MNDKLQILGIAGSLRSRSYHKALLHAARDLVPETAQLNIFESLGDIPAFNQDLEDVLPSIVSNFKEQIRASDAVIFATPEYNYSVPGVLKNAIDWASRPYGDNSWERKPVGIMSGSLGMIGGARAQYHLRQTFVFLNMFPLNQPEVIIPQINEKMDDEGNFLDDHTRDKVDELIHALIDWTITLSARKPVTQAPVSEQHPYDDAYSRMTP